MLTFVNRLSPPPSPRGPIAEATDGSVSSSLFNRCDHSPSSLQRTDAGFNALIGVKKSVVLFGTDQRVRASGQTAEFPDT